MYDFMELFAPHLTRRLVDQAWHCQSRTEVEAMFEHIELPTF
jgi:LysR family cys regulon transcriptional activator